jgi:hypothetical protein
MENGNMGVGVGSWGRGRVGKGNIGVGVRVGVGEMENGNLEVGVHVGEQGKGNVRVGVSEMGKGNISVGVTFCLGLVVFRERSIRTTIGTVFVHILYFPPTLVASLLLYVVSCDVLVMCRVALFCVVPRPSDTSIVVLGFVTRSTVREEL